MDIGVLLCITLGMFTLYVEKIEILNLKGYCEILKKTCIHMGNDHVKCLLELTTT